MLTDEFIPIVIGNRNLCQGKVRNYVSDYIKVKDNTLTCVDGFSEFNYICAFGEKITEFMPSLNEKFIIISELIAGSVSFTVSEKETLLLNLAEMEFSDWTIELIALLIEEKFRVFNEIGKG